MVNELSELFGSAPRVLVYWIMHLLLLGSKTHDVMFLTTRFGVVVEKGRAMKARDATPERATEDMGRRKRDEEAIMQYL